MQLEAMLQCYGHALDCIRWFYHRSMAHAYACMCGCQDNKVVGADGLLKMAFTDLRASQLAKSHPVLSGIFTTVCDASSLTAADSSKNGQRQALQDSVAASSAIVLLLTRADKPAHTEASLGALLGSAPAALQVPLVLLTTAPDLHHGVQQWLHTLPGTPCSLPPRRRR